LGGECLDWLQSILACIAEDAEKARDEPARLLRIKKLAAAANYLALDYGNLIDCEHENMVDSLKAAGLKLIDNA
jgi:hypothetical protein